MSLERALKKRYNPNHNPWDPPIRNYKNSHTWPTYPTVRSPKPKKHHGVLHNVIKAVNSYGNGLGGGAGPRMPTKEEYARARRIRG